MEFTISKMPPSMPHPILGALYRHHSGRVYTVLQIANVAHPSDKFPVMVVYIGQNGNVWSRLLSEFMDEVKFKLIPMGKT